MVTLYQALRLAAEPIALVDLAYFVARLGQVGVNPELNQLRAAAILDVIPTPPPDVETRRTAVRAISLLAAGQADEAGKLKPKLEGARDERALEATFLLETDANQALQTAEDLIRMSPTNAKYYHYKGLAAAKAGQSDLASASLTRAIAMSPSLEEAKLDLNALTRTGKIEAAAQPPARWPPEPSGFPFGRIAVFADLLAPPSAAIGVTITRPARP